MHRISNLAMMAVLAALALVFSFDVTVGNLLASLGPEGLLMAPVAAATLPESIKAELEKIRTTCVEPVDGLSARLSSVEQVVAKIDIEGGPFGGGGAPGQSPGSLAVDALTGSESGGDVQFQNAVQAAAQNKKLPGFSARVTVEGSIRAALTTDGWGDTGDTSVPSNPTRRGFVGPVARPLRLLDVLPSRPTSSDAVEYIRISSTGDAGEQDLQGDVKSEVDMAGTLARADIATIAAWTAASRQVLADNSALRQMINNVIRNKVLSRLEHQLINGTGAQGKIHGLLPLATAFVPTIGTRPADVIGESIVRQENNGYRPNLILLNPLDFYRMQITQVNTTDYEYVFGSPMSPLPQALWNRSIVTTPSVPEGRGMTIDTSYMTVLDREQMTVMVGNQHEDFFVRNLVAILGELRAGLEVLDEWAAYAFDLEFPELTP